MNAGSLSKLAGLMKVIGPERVPDLLAVADKLVEAAPARRSVTLTGLEVWLIVDTFRRVLDDAGDAPGVAR